MSTVRQGHEGEKGPVIVDSRITAIVNAKPALDLGTSVEMLELRDKKWDLDEPRVMEAHNTDDGLKAVGTRRGGHREAHALQEVANGGRIYSKTIPPRHHLLVSQNGISSTHFEIDSESFRGLACV